MRSQCVIMGLAIYSPKISDNLRLFSQVIFTSQFNADLNQHLFSNQQFRLGVGIKDWFQIGGGFDNTLIGPIRPSSDELVPGGSIHFRNIGLFIRKEI